VRDKSRKILVLCLPIAVSRYISSFENLFAENFVNNNITESNQPPGNLLIKESLNDFKISGQKNLS
jgi:hypothetical protein